MAKSKCQCGINNCMFVLQNLYAADKQKFYDGCRLFSITLRPTNRLNNSTDNDVSRSVGCWSFSVSESVIIYRLVSIAISVKTFPTTTTILSYCCLLPPASCCSYCCNCCLWKVKTKYRLFALLMF